MLPFFRLIGQQLKMRFSHPLPRHSRYMWVVSARLLEERLVRFGRTL